MKIVTFEDIQKMNIDPEQCYRWVEEVIQHKKDSFLPPKTHMNMEGNIFCNVMPSIVHSDDRIWGGVKVVTRYPERIPALDSKILLFDAETGNFEALMDANWITAMRTGAVAAHSVLQFAKQDFKTIGMIGLGNTARATLLVLSSMLSKDIHIKLLRYKNQAELFEERFQDYPHLHFSICDTPSDLIKGSDVVISCATYFENDICEDDCFEKGILIVPVHTRGFTNCDLFFDKIYADDTGHVDHFKNFAKFKYFAEVSDVVNHQAKGRENNDERILVYNIGISLHDIYFASRILETLKSNSEVYNSLTDANMHDPVEKFWI